MADQEQVDRLRQGVAVWNQWRRHYPDVPVYLLEADLSGVDLSGAFLWKAKLSFANLREANWATFLSNTNTWTSVQVATELSPFSGRARTLYSQWYGWKANTNFNAPAGSVQCVDASITLYDNRYQSNQTSTDESWC